LTGRLGRQGQGQAQAQAQAFHRTPPVLRNPAFAARSSRDPAMRALARTAFHGHFAQQFGPRFADRRGRHDFHRHGIVLGWVGPVFWPYAYNDFVDYTFSPYAYDTFWPYAYDDVYEGVFGQFAYDEADSNVSVGSGDPGRIGVANGRRGRAAARSASRSDAQQVPTAGGSQVCSERAPALTEWPIERIAQTVEPTDAQRAALDGLRDAAGKAVQILQTACPTDLPSTPTGRLAAMRLRLEVMLQAVQTVRPALVTFYDSLNDEQKARFNTIALGNDQGQRARRDLTQVCSERAAGAGSLPVDRIEKTLRVDEPQRAALESLQKAIADAADVLKVGCPTEEPISPTARVEAMEQRLNAMLQALTTVQPALEKFYNSLTDEQKARFNTLSIRQA
jgi:hypothetical protein